MSLLAFYHKSQKYTIEKQDGFIEKVPFYQRNCLQTTEGTLAIKNAPTAVMAISGSIYIPL
jgi:hypothetical protein